MMGKLFSQWEERPRKRDLMFFSTNLLSPAEKSCSLQAYINVDFYHYSSRGTENRFEAAIKGSAKNTYFVIIYLTMMLHTHII